MYNRASHTYKRLIFFSFFSVISLCSYLFLLFFILSNCLTHYIYLADIIVGFESCTKTSKTYGIEIICKYLAEQTNYYCFTLLYIFDIVLSQNDGLK